MSIFVPFFFGRSLHYLFRKARLNPHLLRFHRYIFYFFDLFIYFSLSHLVTHDEWKRDTCLFGTSSNMNSEASDLIAGE